MTGFLDLTGDWLINDGSRAYSARLEQRGNRLSGVYDENRGTIDGLVESNVIRIRWDQPTTRRAGDSELIIATDGKSMSGVWSYDPRAYGSGLTGSGQWTFTRLGQPHDEELERMLGERSSRSPLRENVESREEEMTQRRYAENPARVGDNSNVIFTKIYEFDPNKFVGGYNPNGRLIIDGAGNLYGVTLYGGLNPGDDSWGSGVVFRLIPVSGGAYEHHVLHTFKGGPTDGARPVGGLMMDSAGNLYGTASTGGSGWTGTVFKLTPRQHGGGYDLTNLYEFSPMSSSKTNWDGATPTSSLIMDSNGALFGTTSNGGTNGGGTVFRLTKQEDGKYSFENLHNFGALQGYDDTTGGLTMDPAGNLYGLKALGGDYASGELFGLFISTDQTYAYQSLYSFPQTFAGGQALPMGSLVIDGSGQLFGTTSQGGDNVSGTVFKYPSGSPPRATTLYSFNDLNGPSVPDAGVILDSAGNLFGTASYSSPGYGAVYKLTNNGDGTYSYATLFDLEHQRQGNAPESSLLADPFGRLFGTTVEGGTYDGGVVFKISETAQAIAVMEAGVVLRIVVTHPGRGYVSPPMVSITPSPNGMTAQAVATVSNGSVTTVSVTNQGSGYDFGPLVSFTPPD